VVQARHCSIARARRPFGHGTALRILSSPPKKADQPALWCGARGLAAVTPGTNNSAMCTPRGLRASGCFAASTSSGTITVRAQ